MSTVDEIGESPTVPLRTGRHRPVTVASWPLRVLRGLSGAIAVGLAVLAVVLLIVQLIGHWQGVTGPGLVALLGHLVAAVAALLAQAQADRRTGRWAYAAVALVLAITAALLWFFWWA